MKSKLFNKFMALLMAGAMTFTSVPVNAAGTGETTGESYEQADVLVDPAEEETSTGEPAATFPAEEDLAADEESVEMITEEADENAAEENAALNGDGTGTAADEIITEADAETAAGAAAEEFTYVLMNIPYGEFYEAEGDGAVDAVASATKSKPRALSLAGGSYHVSEAGEDITGIIYPVRLDADEYAALQDMAAAGSIDVIDDDASKEYTVRLRGQDTTVTLTGRENLFEAPSYSFYVLGEEPSSYKEMSADESGTFSFGAATGTAGIVDGAGASAVSYFAHHADVEIKLSGIEVPTAADGEDPIYVSGVVVTDENGSQYGLRHVNELWRNTEIGWNFDDERLGDLTGSTITNIRYYFSNGTITDYPVEIDTSAYLLMNIPYDEFYDAEGDGDVDAVASATKSKPRALTLAGGSYHVNETGEDITGIIYPVKADTSSLKALKAMRTEGTLKVITDRDSKEYTVRLRGQDTTVTLTGRENLFEAPSYSFYVLGEAPSSYKEMSADESGVFSFGAATAEAGTVEGLTGSITLNARHADVEIKLNGVEVPAAAEGGDPVYVSGVVVTDENGSRYGLRHVKELWRNTEIGWNYDDARLGGLTGTTITNVRYYFSNGTITDYPCEIAYKVAKYNEDPANHALIQADDQTADQLSTYLTAITSVTVNGTEYNNSETPIIRTADAKDEEGNVTVAAGTIDLNAEADGKQIFDGTAEYELTVHATAHDDYTFTLVAPKIISGKNPSRKDNESKELTVKTDANAAYFRDVKVNGASLAEGQYSLAEDETEVTFADSYLKTLAVGKYKVEIVSANGAAETTLTIQSSKVAVKGVRLNKSAAKVEKGRSLQLKATVTPTNATEKAVTWKSSNASVASVDRNGKVTAKKAGTAKITVTTKDGRKTAVCTVTVYEKIALYRFYNRRTGDHMYTVSATERLRLIASGWKAEGIACYVPKKSSTPVYRLYNRSNGDHMFTRSEAERQAMISAGWKYEGIGFYSDSDKKVPVYRLYNPNAVSGAHFFTASKAERDNLIKAGWKDEKLGFFGI